MSGKAKYIVEQKVRAAEKNIRGEAGAAEIAAEIRYDNENSHNSQMVRTIKYFTELN